MSLRPAPTSPYTSRIAARFRFLLPALVAALAACGGQSTTRSDGDAGESGDSGESSTGGSAGSASGGRSNSAGRGGNGQGGNGTAGSISAGAAGTPALDLELTRVRRQSDRPLDLLLMIDNSLAMAEKQRLLENSLPLLLRELATFASDVNIGIITSSLGDHGSQDVCSDTSEGRTPDDRAQLLPSVRPDLMADPSGFLNWQPGNNDDAVANGLVSQFRAVGELGCGYEASLEAWYRFLVDPEPVSSMKNDSFVSVRSDANPVVLQQRSQFLRPGSLVGIVMLTDENDCSILDENDMQGWVVPYKGGPNFSSWRMPDSTQSCKDNPNSPCCRPCVSEPAPGCPNNTAELCMDAGYLSIVQDAMILRCHQQLRRFGIDLLYPTSRYVEALTNLTIDPRLDDNPVPNPLFAGPGERSPGDVFLVGILGVPWQDVATPESLADARKLDFMTADDLAAQGRWEVILGDPAQNVPPADALMIESIDPRPIASAHPLLPGVAIVAPDGASRNPINGHEQAVDPNRRDDLQFACIFRRSAPLVCNADNAAGCECNADEYARHSPLCEYGAANTDGVQFYEKAYPGTRQLEVLKGIGKQGLVTSICPKNLAAEAAEAVDDPNYGYNPVARGIAGLLRRGRHHNDCLDTPLPTEPTDYGDQLACPLLVATLDCNCDAERGLIEIQDADFIDRVRAELAAESCLGLPDCEPCLCEMQEHSGKGLAICQNSPASPEGDPGFCYLDAASPVVDPALVAECAPGSQRRIQFSGPEDADIVGAFVVCPR
jgi:hypothetical protein